MLFVAVLSESEIFFKHRKSERAVEISAHTVFLYICFYFQHRHLHRVAKSFVVFKQIEFSFAYSQIKAKTRKRIRSCFLFSAVKARAALFLRAFFAGGREHYRAVAIFKITLCTLCKIFGVRKYFFVFSQISKIRSNKFQPTASVAFCAKSNICSSAYSRQHSKCITSPLPSTISASFGEYIAEPQCSQWQNMRRAFLS